MIAVGLAILIFLQPNLSNVIVILVIWGALVWIAGIELKQLGLILLVGLLILIIGFQFLEPYQQERVTGFLISDPNATYGAQYNVDQALIALGSGGFLEKDMDLELKHN